MLNKIIKKIFFESKIVDYLIRKNNNKILKKVDDQKFLESLCMWECEPRVLDLDKYSRLMKMVKRKYK